MKVQSIAFAVLVCLSGLATFSTTIAAEKMKTVAEIYENKATLAGQTISVQGKVVKVVNGIMKRNFIHVQDGTGDADSSNLIVTSKQTANVGDQVSVSGVVAVNRDFGGGYTYALLIEEATISPKK